MCGVEQAYNLVAGVPQQQNRGIEGKETRKGLVKALLSVWQAPGLNSQASVHRQHILVAFSVLIVN